MNKFNQHLQTGTQSTNIEDTDPIGNIIANEEFNRLNNYDANVDSSDSFLIDTFKRARMVGFPIHELTRQYEPRPSNQFSTDGYDY